jgi:hypothetical protein
VPRRTSGALAFWAGAGDGLYVRHFRGKCGDALAQIFPFGDESPQYAATLGVEKMMQAGDYAGVIARCVAHRP